MIGFNHRDGNQALPNPNAKGYLNPAPPEQSGPSPKTPGERPLVLKLEGRDCNYEKDFLAAIATVQFCDANSFLEIRESVFNEAVGVFVWNAIHLGREEIAKFKALKYIVKLGPGLRNVDVTAAGEMGIAVSHVTGFGIEEAANSTLSMILEIYSRPPVVPLGSNASAPQTPVFHGTRIQGQTLGLIGFGLVGRAVSIRAKALGFTVIFYDPYIGDGIETIFGVTRVTQLNDLLTQADCVSLHCGLTQETVRMINYKTIQFMRPGVKFVNISGRELVDEMALATALRNGRIGAAALDFHTNNSNADILSNAPNVLRTPGTAFLSQVSLQEFREASAREMRAFLEERVVSPRLRYLKNGSFFRI